MNKPIKTPSPDSQRKNIITPSRIPLESPKKAVDYGKLEVTPEDVI